MILIDADTILYSGLNVCEGYYNQLRAINNILGNIIEYFDQQYVLAISGGTNFRKQIYPEYKQNRKDKPRPRYLYDSQQYLLKYWNATRAKGEADDLIAELHDESTIIVGIDKDFYQLGGMQFNPRKWHYVDLHPEPMIYFWTQMLCGDDIDNIPGVRNPSKSHYTRPPNFTWDSAFEALQNVDWRDFVREMYAAHYGDDWRKYYERNAKLIWLSRMNLEVEDIW